MKKYTEVERAVIGYVGGAIRRLESTESAVLIGVDAREAYAEAASVFFPELTPQEGLAKVRDIYRYHRGY